MVIGSTPKAEVSVHARSFCNAIGKVFCGKENWETEVGHPTLIVPPEKYHGCTDGLIALNIAKYGLGIPSDVSYPRLGEIFTRMYEYVAKVDDKDFIRGIEPLPGVISTLTALKSNHGNDILCGLVTGNVEGIAR